MGKPSIYPTGVTLFDPLKTMNGYTLFPSAYGATLIDMNGRLVHIWKGMSSNPLKALPGGRILCGGGNIPGPPGANASLNAVGKEWDGREFWKFDQNRPVRMPDGTQVMASKHHHDYEFEHYPVYATPDMDKGIDEERVLLLTHDELYDVRISDSLLKDERIIETDMQGNLLWEWCAHDHVDELGLDETARKALYNYPMLGGDWIHLNAVATLGKNRHYDAGDDRFAPENIICSSRQLNIIFIIDKKSGQIVWRVGPDFTASEKLKKLGQIIGQHHAHMIPAGLPGAGNILVFDNGSFGGYGAANGCAPDGTNAVRRHYSRVLEFDPVTLEPVWEYMKAVRNKDDVNEMAAHTFFSAFISAAQRLPNGNTLITEGADGILLEVTPDKEIVWEFVNPIARTKGPSFLSTVIYRAYRVPYEWVPQLTPPELHPVIPPDIYSWRVPGSDDPGDPMAVMVE